MSLEVFYLLGTLHNEEELRKIMEICDSLIFFKILIFRVCALGFVIIKR